MADADEPQGMLDVVPNLGRRRLGKITFADAATALCRADLGSAFQREWTKRRDQAVNYLDPRGLSPSLRNALCGGAPPRRFD